MKLEDDTFELYAAKHYDNVHCHDISEFEDDLKRFYYIKKLFNKYLKTGDLKERLVLNHLIIVYNCFGVNATNMLFLKLEGFHSCLKPFLKHISFLPTYVEYNNKIVFTDRIETDKTIEAALERLNKNDN